ncbi:MAG: MotA/TolQ/ExbB proton channel family protein [Dysgonamonadaceae bacterium]|nr:MotA/TolQ/ExbB proton channel family protein [Dysgonamonadaceae bacterium]
MNPLLFIQEDITRVMETADVLSTQPAEVEMNILELATKGGWIMIPIVLLLFIAMAVFIERVLVINKAAKEDDTFMARINDYIHEGNIKSAEKLCQTTETPYSRMIMKGIQRLGRPMNDILVAIENVGNIEVAKLEKGFAWIATAAAGAPMLGFLGTVTGMVRAFFDMANAGNNVDITLLSSGIYEALVTTVAGLIVGIIALFAYNFLVARVDNVITKMETKTMDFMDLLNEPTKG